MGIKDLFTGKNKALDSTSINKIGKEVESENYIKAKIVDKDRFVPIVDFTNPKNFVKFGSAKQYFEDAIKRIYNDYPFDGSLYEKLAFHNSSSYLDRYIFENEYPRTTGYVAFSPTGWGTQITASDNGYGKPTQPEYIEITGTMNVGPNVNIRTKNMLEGGRIGANIYNSGSTINRTLNLKVNGADGNTVEFWLKKESLTGNNTQKEVIFDLWNGETVDHGAGSQYGRFAITVTSSVSPNPVFLVTYVSGTVSACTEQVLGATDTSVSPSTIFNDKWNHFSISTVNDGDHLNLQLYKNGELNDTRRVSNGAINVITGAIVASIGALRANSTTTSDPAITPSEGYGKLSGALDEFRFWKKRRSSKQISRYWNDQVGGGTNTDTANTDLGVYYKFNEGRTELFETDRKVLDYSGRISHGIWIGYSSSAQPHRLSGSAINEVTASSSEFKDPIIYSFHPSVKAFYNNKIETGSYYDVTNNSSIYNSLPAWMIEEDQEKDRNNLLKITQIVASYFDTLYLQIKELPKLKHNEYTSGSLKKPLPFSNKLLTSVGFIAPDIFADASLLSWFLDRDETVKFSDQLFDIRNLIYKNIYNNISYIYKSKGTEKSIRNLIRCFGVDDELIRVNLYGNNIVHTLDTTYRSTTVKKKYIDFSHPDRYDSLIYQFAETDNDDSVSFLSSSHVVSGLTVSSASLTAEVDVILPRGPAFRSVKYYETPFITASVFGAHRAHEENTTDTTWGALDSPNFQVYVIRERPGSRNAYFKLTGSSGGYFPALTSSMFNNVYNNQRWNLAVKLKPKTHPFVEYVSGTSDIYEVEFYGVNSEAGVVYNEFWVTGTMNASQSSDVFGVSKRFYVGAHRTNFTGSVVDRTDVKIGSMKVWLDYLTNSEIRSHAFNPENYGRDRPYENAYQFNTSSNKQFVPKIKTLALNWGFNQVTASDGSSQFFVKDLSSGSIVNRLRYGWLGNILEKQHTGRGDKFLVNDHKVVDVEYIPSIKQRTIGSLESTDLISILDRNDETFTRESRPIEYFFAIEKSLYQSISEDMLKMFSTVSDFNNLIGNPVNRYRLEYKDLNHLRSLYFDQVHNTIDFEKFLDYYKWMDNSINQMILQLVPASAEINDSINNVIESHILERSKYRNKLFNIENKLEDLEAGAQGINAHLYNWKFGHFPENQRQDTNAVWWKLKHLRSDIVLKTNDITTDDNVRNRLFSASVETTERSFTTPYKIKGDIT